MKKARDDYFWHDYTNIYSAQLNELINKDGYDFVIKNSKLENGKLVWADKLHETRSYIYTKIFETGIKSVIEGGCGPGHDLYNIKKLMPYMDVFGIELLETQCVYGYRELKLPEEFYNNIVIADLVIPDIWQVINKKSEFVFTHEVIKYICHNNAVNFIKNIMKLTSKYLLLVEDYNSHQYELLFEDCGLLEDFKQLSSDITPNNCFYFIRK